MRNLILPYILPAVCFLAACSTDCYEPDSGTKIPGENNMLTLTVSASQPVVQDGISTRAENKDEMSYTNFEKGDSIGVIVMDAAGNLLADNVPFRYDGTNWAFDADKDGEDKRPYYDAAMTSYIVYFPYKHSADGCTSVDKLKNLEDFAHQDNQNLKEDYLSSDIMVWTSEGETFKSIPAKMSHVHNTFSLAQPNIKWDLVPVGEELLYAAKDETLSDLIIEYTPTGGDKIIIKDNETDLTYRATDRSYRYLLPETPEGALITWQYVYRETLFKGKRVIPAGVSGTRFSNYDVCDMGQLPGPKMQFSDYYCTTTAIKDESNADKANVIGYVVPWDADEPLKLRHCIGLVVYVGQHPNDTSDYTSSPIGEKKCNGYVLSLTDTYCEPFLEKINKTDVLPWWILGNDYKTTRVGTVDISVGVSDWSGYYNTQKIKEFSQNTEHGLLDFPAAYTCVNYGKYTVVDGEMKEMQTGLEAPANSTEWFMPTARMLYDLKRMGSFKIGGTLYSTDLTNSEYSFEKMFNERLDSIKTYAIKKREEEKDPIYPLNEHCKYLDLASGICTNLYWGSNEFHQNSYEHCAIGLSGQTLYYFYKATGVQNSQIVSHPLRARAVLAF